MPRKWWTQMVNGQLFANSLPPTVCHANGGNDLYKSDLPSATTFYNTYPLTLMTSSRTYDGFNRLQSVSNKIGYTSNVINSHVYSYNTAGRRSTATVETGDAWNWLHNDRGEVTDAKKAWSGGGYLRGRSFTYGYDDTGNRTTHSSGGTTAGGTTRTVNYNINPDGTNEIQSLTNPSAFDVTGLASGTVTVGDNPLDTALMQGAFFHAERNETAEAGKVQPGLRHVVVTAGGYALHGDVYVPEAAETTAHDGSGNLISDSRWTYTWTEDNRLREISTRSTSGIANASAACVRVAFDYDYLGRRVQKRTYHNFDWNYPSSGTLQKTVKYVWDDWNCIAELNGADSKFFIWGPDLSGGTGAGGVGGLLFVQDLSGSYTLETNHCVAYDGSGNVTAIVDGMYGNGAVEAAYEYDPFGNTIRQSGPYALTNPFRFSTKLTDDESGLVYYGYRYYDPVRGRWPSRDPIAEQGGLNLYGMVGNDPVNQVDALGLMEVRYQWQNILEVQVINNRGTLFSKNNGLSLGSVEVKFKFGECGLSADVIATNVIKMNTYADNMQPGLSLYNNSLAHERRHAMSWFYKVKNRIVHPLTQEKSDNGGNINNRIVATILHGQIKALYTKLLMEGGDHAGDNGATEFSPFDGSSWAADLGVARWEGQMRLGAKQTRQGMPNAVFGGN